jgi:hypothetical protein
MAEPFKRTWDDACWGCVVEQLKGRGDADAALVAGLDGVQEEDREAALAPFAQEAVDAAWQLCRHRLECR